MKRIDIIYGGAHYSLGGRDPESVRAEIEVALTAGVGWLRVNEGEGAAHEAFLLVTPGVPLALIPAPDPLDAEDGPPWNEGALFVDLGA